jgi:hypothetical protein
MSEFVQVMGQVLNEAKGKFAVTQEQWRSIAQLPKVKVDLDIDPSHFKGTKRPVEQVCWEHSLALEKCSLRYCPAWG